MSLFSLSQSNAGLSTSGTTLNLTLFGVAAFSLGWYLGKRSWKPLAMQSYEEFVNADDNSPLSKLAEEYQDFKMVNEQKHLEVEKRIHCAFSGACRPK